MRRYEYNPKHRLRIDTLDLTLQTRVETDATVVDEYAEAMAGGTKFPPISVREVDGRYIVTDGFHRVAAAQRNGEEDIIANVLPGVMANAYRDALKANAEHGLRRTNADKRNALEIAWKHRRIIWRNDGADPSAALLAEVCGVSLRTAKSFVAEIQPVQIAPVESPAADVQPVQIAEVPTMPRRIIGADGKVRKMPTRPAQPMPTRPASVAVGFGAQRVAGHAVPVDRYGAEIPVAIHGAFTVEGEKELRDLLAHISAARVALRKGLDGRNLFFAAMRQDTLLQLDNAYRFVSAAEPHCVCRICQGTGCKACHGRGWQTEEEYKRNPKEFLAEGGAA